MSAGKIILVTGGARSGKSEIAEQLAASMPGRVIYLATAGIHDGEMAERVKRHRDRRPAGWETVEETHRLPDILGSLPSGTCVLVDCLTLWITNLLLDDNLFPRLAGDGEKEEYIAGEMMRVVEAAKSRQLVLILVSNQVGCGVVPENRLARLFRDIAGRINRLAASEADRVYLVTAGIPVELKSIAAKIGREEI